MEITNQLTLVERLFMFVHTISWKWVDRKSRTFQTMTRTTLKFTFSIEFLGEIYATLIWQEVDVSWKILTLSWPQKEALTIDEKSNKFYYVEADLMALNADKDEHILYNVQLLENEDKNGEDIVCKATVLRLWEGYWNQCL